MGGTRIFLHKQRRGPEKLAIGHQKQTAPFPEKMIASLGKFRFLTKICFSNIFKDYFDLPTGQNSWNLCVYRKFSIQDLSRSRRNRVICQVTTLKNYGSAMWKMSIHLRGRAYQKPELFGQNMLSKFK